MRRRRTPRSYEPRVKTRGQLVLRSLSPGQVCTARVWALWGAGAPSDQRRIPTFALIYFGAFFIVNGGLILIPGYWRWYAERSRWPTKTVFGDMRGRDALRSWRRVLWHLQTWFVTRMQQREEAMRWDPRPYQPRYSAMALTAGMTLLLYAAIR